MLIANINCIYYKNGNCHKFGRTVFFHMFHPTCKLIEHQPCGYQEKYYNPINDLCPKKENNMVVKKGDEIEVKIDLEEVEEKELSSFEMFKVIDSTGVREMTYEEKMKFKDKMSKMRRSFNKIDKMLDDLGPDESIKRNDKDGTLSGMGIKISFL